MYSPAGRLQAARIAIAVCCACVAACAGVGRTQPQQTVSTVATVAQPTIDEIPEPQEPIVNTAAPSAVEAVPPAPSIAAPRVTEEKAPVRTTPSAGAASPEASAAAAAPPKTFDLPTAAAKPPALPQPPAKVATPALVELKPAPAPVAAPPPAAPLDLGSLETRLRQTKAIGVFTKLALKNQVDDLLKEFRAYHKQQTAATLTELRRTYDMLMLKALALLQDGDPRLARDIVKSRAAIWSILADRKKFTESNLMAGSTP